MNQLTLFDVETIARLNANTGKVGLCCHGKPFLAQCDECDKLVEEACERMRKAKKP